MSAWKKKTKVFTFIALVGAVVLAGLFLTTPTHEGEWQEAQKLLPDVQIEGHRYLLRNIRDFSYLPDKSIGRARYLEQEFSPNNLKRVWLGLSHFTDYGFAHSFLSFEFEDGRYLVASVEARKRPEQTYSPLAGLFRRYHKIIVLGTERDIIGVRSHVGGQRVLLYPLELTAAQGRRVFAGMMQDVRTLREKPSFYNTLFDNCTTSLLRYDPDHRFWKNILDYRILLPGFADDFAVERGWIRDNEGLEELRRKAVVDAGVDPDDENFSKGIRHTGICRISEADQGRLVQPCAGPGN
ncbi:MAG: DUF4105 domain-containing protein [Syntrophotaleaceae bacterium]